MIRTRGLDLAEVPARAIARPAARTPGAAWRHLHGSCILMQMRTTLNLDEELLARATRLTGIREKTALLHAGLEALVARESARRLAALGGTEKALRPVRRRRSSAAS